MGVLSRRPKFYTSVPTYVHVFEHILKSVENCLYFTPLRESTRMCACCIGISELIMVPS